MFMLKGHVCSNAGERIGMRSVQIGIDSIILYLLHTRWPDACSQERALELDRLMLAVIDFDQLTCFFLRNSTPSVQVSGSRKKALK